MSVYAKRYVRITVAGLRVVIAAGAKALDAGLTGLQWLFGASIVLGALYLAGLASWLFAFGAPMSFAADTTIVFPLSCNEGFASDGSCSGGLTAVPTVAYKVNPPRGEVVGKVEGSNDIVSLSGCTIFDSANWMCSGPLYKLQMKDGRLESSPYTQYVDRWCYVTAKANPKNTSCK